jgi:hypothetical protein
LKDADAYIDEIVMQRVEELREDLESKLDVVEKAAWKRIEMFEKEYDLKLYNMEVSHKETIANQSEIIDLISAELSKDYKKKSDL